MINLLDYNQSQLADLLVAEGFQRFRANQIIQWVHQKQVTDVNEMSNLNGALKHWLKTQTQITPPTVKKTSESSDGTIKWLLGSPDNEPGHYEMVYIPEKSRATLCVSSQVGCALACDFCATGKQGFTRNLTCHEIIGQLWLANQVVEALGRQRVTNVVFMGMGEPLMNVNPVFKAVELMLSDHAYGLSKYRVTISTVGVLPVMQTKLNKDGPALAVSLHAPNEDLRNRLIPLNKKFSLAELIQTCFLYNQKTNRDVTFEYTMMRGINDQPEHAHQLIRLLKQLKCKINLIPCNPIEESLYQPSKPNDVAAFQNTLKKAGYQVTVRKTRGDDIDAACGQLAKTFLKTNRSLVRIETNVG